MIIVTGGAGFIGSAFIAKLNAHEVRNILVVDSADHSAESPLLKNKMFVKYMEREAFIDLLRRDALPSAPSAIVHMGACSTTTERNVDFLNSNNIEYSKSIIEYASQRGIRCVYASSAATYGDGSEGYSDDEALLQKYTPLNLYGDSKQRVDLWARDQGFLKKVVGLKFFNVYGPNEYYKGEQASVVWKAFNTIHKTGAFTLFKSHHPEYADGEQKRDFVYVKDCCEVMWWLLHNPAVNGIFNVGSGKARSWNDLLRSVCAAMGRQARIEFIDTPEAIRNHYQYFTEASMHKLHAAGYTRPFMSLEDGVRDYIVGHLMKPDIIW